MIHDLMTGWAASRSFRLAIADMAAVEEVRAEIENWRTSGKLPAAYFQDNLSGFTYLEGVEMKSPRSIILVAVPRPSHVLAFAFGGKVVETIIPPTYLGYRAVFHSVRDSLQNALSGTEHEVRLVHVPLKALAERLGLIRYGRNNIGYIDGLGSGFQLVGMVSDTVPSPARSKPRGRALLPRCRSCSVCIEKCSRGAIGRGRFLLHAVECYTLFSESLKPVPEHVKPPSPECLVGCMKCQEVCPENEGRLHYERAAVSFSSEETEAFLGRPDALPSAREAAEMKFLSLGLSGEPGIYIRNLNRILGLAS